MMPDSPVKVWWILKMDGQPSGQRQFSDKFIGSAGELYLELFYLLESALRHVFRR